MLGSRASWPLARGGWERLTRTGGGGGGWWCGWGGGRLLLLALNVMAAVLKELLLGHQVARQGVALLQVTRVAAKNR